MVENEHKKPIGLIWINHIDMLHRNAESGYFIGEESFRGMGYGAEGRFLILKYAFEFLNLNKVYGYVFAFNKKVISLCKKLGYKHEGILRKHIFHAGEFQDVIIHSILREEYFQNKASIEKMFDDIVIK